VTINQEVRTSRDATLLVDFEIFDSNGNRVWQDALDNQPVSASATGSFTATYTVPANLPPGTYSVKTGLFSPGWGNMYSWSDMAGSFVVDTSAASSAAANVTANVASSPADYENGD
jgi:hypothetical protein